MNATIEINDEITAESEFHYYTRVTYTGKRGKTVRYLKADETETKVTETRNFTDASFYIVIDGARRNMLKHETALKKRGKHALIEVMIIWAAEANESVQT